MNLLDFSPPQNWCRNISLNTSVGSPLFLALKRATACACKPANIWLRLTETMPCISSEYYVKKVLFLFQYLNWMKMKHLGVSIFSLFLTTSLAVTTIPYPPTIARQPSHEQLFQVSQTQEEQDRPFVLDCEAHGNPEPT